MVGGLEHLFFHILGRIIPTDFHIFQRGRYTTNQLLIVMSSNVVKPRNQFAIAMFHGAFRMTDRKLGGTDFHRFPRGQHPMIGFIMFHVAKCSCGCSSLKTWHHGMIHNIAFQPIPYPGACFEPKNRSRGPLESLAFLGPFPEFDEANPRDTCDISFGWFWMKCDSPSQNVQDMRGSGQGWIGSFSSEGCRWVALIDIKYSTYFMNFHDTSACCCHLTWPQPILGRGCSELQAYKLTLPLISYPADTLRLTTW